MEKKTKSLSVSNAATENIDILSPAHHSDIPDELFILPVCERPFFPPQTLPILLNEAPWLDTVKLINKLPQRYAGLVLAKVDSIDKVRF